MGIKIGYGILCHKDPHHIERLCLKLAQDTECEIFVHVDAKSDISLFPNDRLKTLNCGSRIHILDSRIEIFWAGWNSIRATILLMEQALFFKCNRFVLLQGLEYPIKNMLEIKHFFYNNREKEFIKAQNISLSNDFREYHKYSLYWFLDYPTNVFHKLLYYTNCVFLRTGIIPRVKKNYVIDSKGQKNFIYHGCAQFGITREATEYIVNFYHREKNFNKYFCSMYAPDESYFHTILYNSPIVSEKRIECLKGRQELSTLENLTYFEYPSYPQKVIIKYFLFKSEFDKLNDSGFLFVRKVSSESNDLLDYIDTVHKKVLKYSNSNQ